MKTALITGITGQDGHYLAELLLNKGYRVVGTTRNLNKARLELSENLSNLIQIFEWDLINSTQISQILEIVMPDEVYNFAAFTSIDKMLDNPVEIGLINGLAVSKLLDSINKFNPKIKFAQASSSEMYGVVTEKPQSENTPFIPKNPYGISKYYGHQMVNYYREQYGIFSCSGILFNHESNRRPHNFVTRKITSTAAKIKLGFENQLVLGNLNVERDWIHARDAVNAMWFMLQTDSPSDYVIASGNSRSVSDFCKTAFEYLGLNYKDYVVSSDKFIRSMESFNLVGCAKKINNIGWLPKTSFETMVNDMVENDYNLLSPFKFKK